MNRRIFDAVAGDTVEIPLERNGVQYTLIDTAGLRRRARVSGIAEKFSVVKTLKAIEGANVVVLMLDAREGVSEQDARLLGFVAERGRGLVIAVLAYMTYAIGFTVLNGFHSQDLLVGAVLWLPSVLRLLLGGADRIVPVPTEFGDIDNIVLSLVDLRIVGRTDLPVVLNMNDSWVR